MRYFDAHSHVQFNAFDSDRSAMLERMEGAGVAALVVGVDMLSSQEAVSLAENRPSLRASVGVHPNDAELPATDFAKLRTLASHPSVRAIGECGLDYYRPIEPEDRAVFQKDAFAQHVEIAIDLRKPLMIHARPSKGTADAYRDLIEILASYKREHGERLAGNIHFFVGGVDEARALVELDFTVSYTAVVTFAREYDETVRFLPDTHLLSETDCPYVAPASRRGTRNDPLAIPEIVDALALIRGEDPELMRQAIVRNAERLFSLGIF